MAKSKQKSQLDAADRTCIAMLAPARATAERMGVDVFTRKLCAALEWEYSPNRRTQVETWLTLDERAWKHMRAGVAFTMLEIK